MQEVIVFWIIRIDNVICYQKTSLLVEFMFLLVAFFFLLYLYMYAWPADHMKDMVYMVDKWIINV